MANATSSLHDLASARFQAMRQQQGNEPKKETEANNSTSIEVPEAIKNLTTGTAYWIKAKSNRYKKLIREGHGEDLLEIAALALTKDNPAHWFATSAGKKMWERTLDFLKKRRAVLKKAEEVAARIGDMAERMQKFLYKQTWAGKSVERYAVAAQEIGKDRHKLFAWLCQHEGNNAAA